MCAGCYIVNLCNKGFFNIKSYTKTRLVQEGHRKRIEILRHKKREQKGVLTMFLYLQDCFRKPPPESILKNYTNSGQQKGT